MAKPDKTETACPACHSDGRSTERPTEMKRSLDARLARIEGQVRGIRRMISEDVYCDDIIAQISAARAALGKTSLLVLEHHLHHCLIERLRAGEDEVADELMENLKRMV